MKWIPTHQASMLLATSTTNLLGRLRPGIRCRNRDSGGGYEWVREDCEEVLRVARTCKLTLRQATRVLNAKREGRL